MAVRRTLRYQVLRRDGNRCQSCGRAAPDVQLQVDHVIPEALGGPSTPENLRTLCADCNGGKSATPPDAATVAQVNSDAVRWAEAMKAAAGNMLADLERRDRVHGEFDQAWNRWKSNNSQQPLPRDADWQDSVDRLLAAGLPMPILIDCVDQAMRSSSIPADRLFRYMCGIAWKRVKDIQKAAASAISEGGEAPLTYEDGRQEVAREVLEWVDEDRQDIFNEALAEFAEEGIDNPAEADVTVRAAVVAARNAWCEVYGRRNSAKLLLKLLPDGIRKDVFARAEADVQRASEDGECTEEDVHGWAVVALGHEIKRRFPEGGWPQGPDVEGQP